jgi:hypothetical protein
MKHVNYRAFLNRDFSEMVQNFALRFGTRAASVKARGLTGLAAFCGPRFDLKRVVPVVGTKLPFS